MSIIGTRPPLISETNMYELHHRARLAIKPGITGMWQVSGRSDITDFEEVVRLDKEYITNWNIGLDIKILFSLCIECGQCKKVCSYQNENIELNEPLLAEAATVTDREICLKSASGGIFAALAKKILQEGGRVYSECISISSSNYCCGNYFYLYDSYSEIPNDDGNIWS